MQKSYGLCENRKSLRAICKDLPMSKMQRVNSGIAKQDRPGNL